MGDGASGIGFFNVLKVGAFLELPLGRAEQVKRAYAGLQTALVYLSNKYPLTQPDEAYKYGICKFNYIAVPLIVRATWIFGI